MRLDEDKFREVVRICRPHVDYDEAGEASTDEVLDLEEFRKWLYLNISDKTVADFFLRNTPSVSLESNVGTIFGRKNFIHNNDENIGRNGHSDEIREKGLIAVGSGVNGDFVVVDIEQSGECGWVPLGMHCDFIPTSRSIGQFYWESEKKWPNVTTNWYDARETFR